MTIFEGKDGYLREVKINKEGEWYILMLKGQYFEDGEEFNDWLDVAKFRDIYHLTVFLDSLECMEEGF